MPAVDLGKMVVSEMLARTDIDPKLIEQVVFGQVVQMPEAPNIAREIVLGTGMHIHTDAYSVTRACATSFKLLSMLPKVLWLAALMWGLLVVRTLLLCCLLVYQKRWLLIYWRSAKPKRWVKSSTFLKTQLQRFDASAAGSG